MRLRVEFSRARRRVLLGCVALCGLGILLQAGCGTIVTSDTLPDGTPRWHNWWNYYERGIRLRESGDLTGALEDFERALGLRAGAKFGAVEDAWRVRTYGMHFLQNYFPNRELGICWYERGAFDKAETFLMRSLEQEPSGRAKHYLNATRARQISRKSVPPPRVFLDGPTGRQWTTARDVLVNGRALGEGWVRDVRVSGVAEFFELARPEVPFSRRVPLKAGENLVTVEAHDLKGQVGTVSTTWIADWDPPQVTVMAARRKADAWEVDLVLTDDNALSRFTATAVAPMDVHGKSSVAVTVPVSAARPTLVALADLAGNRFSTSFTATELAGLDGSQQALAPGRLLAAAAGGATDAPVGLLAAADGAPTDQLPPSLRISARSKVVQIVEEEFFLDGAAEDGGGLASITINGENLMAGYSGAAARRFARRIPVPLGETVITVEARDMAGNANQRTFTIARRVPPLLDPQQRLRIALPPFEASADELKDMYADVVRFSVMGAFVDTEPVRFNVLERDEGWEAILQEQQLSLSDLASSKAKLVVGELFPAELLLLSTLIREPSGSGLTVKGRVVSTSTGRILLTEDVYTESPDDDLEVHAEGLAMKVKQGFPLIEGEVVDVKDDTITLSVGHRHGVRNWTSFIVLDRAAPDADALHSEILEFDGQPVQLTVHRLKRAQVAGNTVRKAAAPQVAPGDFVVSR